MAKPSAIESALTNSVITSACDKNCQRVRMGVRSMSTGGRDRPLRQGRVRDPPLQLTRSCAGPGGSLALEDFDLLGGDVVLHLVVDRLQPVAEDRVLLVDGHADLGRHL